MTQRRLLRMYFDICRAPDLGQARLLGALTDRAGEDVLQWFADRERQKEREKMHHDFEKAKRDALKRGEPPPPIQGEFSMFGVQRSSEPPQPASLDEQLYDPTAPSCSELRKLNRSLLHSFLQLGLLSN